MSSRLPAIQPDPCSIRVRGNDDMASISEKLNLRDQETVVVINSPHSFEDEVRRLKGVEIVRDTQDLAAVEFAIAFVTQRKEVARVARDRCSVGRSSSFPPAPSLGGLGL
jgi:hypothetical protein